VMILLAIAYDAIAKRLRRAMLALAQSPARSYRDVPPEYYRFPLF
jgi:hypothetical protein